MAFALKIQKPPFRVTISQWPGTKGERNKRTFQFSHFLVSILILTTTTFGCSLSKTHPVDDPVPHSPNDVRAESESHKGDHSDSESPPSVKPKLKSVVKVVLDDAKYLLTSPLRIDGKSALITGGVAAGIAGLMVADEEIQEFFQDNRGEPGNSIADGLDVLGSAQVVFAANLGLIAGGFWFREEEEGDKLFQTALVSLEAQLFTEATTGLIKTAVGRARPSEGKGSNFYTPFREIDFDTSFPSSHAARAFAVAAVFADRYEQPVPMLVYSIASLIALSRIYLNEHWASDVLAGSALGFAIGKTLSWRHKYKRFKWTVLPFLPDPEGGVGLAVRYRF